MAWLKYFDKIAAAQQADRDRPAGPLPRFDFASLGSTNALARWLTRFALRRMLPALTALLRVVWPVPRWGRFVLVTRRADAEEVLRDMARFPVVYGPEMRELGGDDNVLSVDGATHDALAAVLHRAITGDDVASIARWVAEDAEALLAAGGGRIDMMRDLVTRTATESCCRLFGITAHDPDLFAEWTMAVSNQLFGDFFGDANVRRQAQTGAAMLRAAIDDAIARWQRDPHSAADTLIARLLAGGMAPGRVRAAVIGLATAFMPTNTLAAGNIMEVLLDRPGMMVRAARAARDKDAAGLRAILLQAGALNPALSPGLWRHVPADAAPTTIGTGWRKRRMRAGDLILVCIPSALRDRAGRRENGAWLMFGHGPHVCLGAELALAHLVAVFGALLRQDDLARARGRHGRMLRTGPFPTRLDLTYRCVNARRAAMVLTLPVRPDVPRKTVEHALDAIGNPVRADVRASLDATDRVQFLSLSVIARAPDAAESILLIEISGDGEDDDLLALIAERCADWLAPIVGYCVSDGGDDLAGRLRRAHRRLHRWPWGATGLHFDGLPDLSVADIARQQAVAEFAATIVHDHLRHDLGLTTRAMDILQRTRRLLKRDPVLTHAPEWQARTAAAPPATTILRPGRRRLAMVDWEPPATHTTLWTLLWAPDSRFIRIAAVALFAGWTAAAFLLLRQHGGWQAALSAGAALLTGLALAPLSLAALAGLFLLLVRWRETRERYDPTAAPLAHVQAIAAREDAPGHVQNHIIAVMPFKPGLIRRFSFALAMWGIKQAVTWWFRPGFVVTMGTIHKARWFRVPGTRQFVFFSNYDGSWESYLEDFITRAHEGQSAAWSHGVGFPPTRFMIQDGAADGDRFKRWVRLQQGETRAWYSRFPALTARRIRRNAMIEDGLARAVSDTDARRWLGEFGSAQRERDEVETQEAQTIVFNGFGRQRQATALFVRLPADRLATANWIGAVTGLHAYPMAASDGPPQRWLTRDSDGALRVVLPPAARVRFGEQVVDVGGNLLAFTAAGLERAGLFADSGLTSLPPVFRMTMAARARLLGDAAPGDWRMSDAPERDDAAHALLTIYGSEPDQDHAATVAAHRQLLAHFGGTVSHLVPCNALGTHAPGTADERELFGFRDGISQPVIRGTRRAGRRLPPRDLLAAGEFLLGYRNEQGFCAPPVVVGAEHDPDCVLPTVDASQTDPYPYFGTRDSGGDSRDFGRNGAFLAVRQLDQDAAGFQRQLDTVSARLRADYPDLPSLAGGAVSAEWLAAKIIGRWRDGTPLVRNRQGPGAAQRTPDNDFSYGGDDPRGLACPLGAHIRRANPRDSLEPGDADEQRITNRHRLIRRGRTYSYAPDADGQRREGLLFMAICADLERQFEFVQRSWLNATSFHGLVDEHDPLLGGPIDDTRCPGFTIPTEAGPLRVTGLEAYVTLRGGGYFFLPSRSALAFLIDRAVRSEGDRTLKGGRRPATASTNADTAGSTKVS